MGWPRPVEDVAERTAELVKLAADEAARALARLAAMNRLASAALNDALTGVPNRRAFDEELPRALARAGRSGQSRRRLRHRTSRRGGRRGSRTGPAPRHA